jgi:hypothetical protein
MSFEIGGVSNHGNRIEGTTPSRDGGGGNTGYFQSGHQEKHEEHKEKSAHDVLELSTAKDEDGEMSFNFKDIKFFEIINNFSENLIKKLSILFKNKFKSGNNTKESDTFKKSN